LVVSRIWFDPVNSVLFYISKINVPDILPSFAV
jgi:hypothetical protein